MTPLTDKERGILQGKIVASREFIRCLDEEIQHLKDHRERFATSLRSFEAILRRADHTALPARIKILADGRCNCTCADPCALGKTGSASRCTQAELAEAGFKLEAP